MRPCTRRIAPAENVIKATSLNDVLGEHAPWCRTAPNALPTHTNPLHDRYLAAVGRRGRQGAMIVGDGLEKRYGRKRALKGVSFSVPRAGFLLVTGPNGSGKTTLLRLVAGLAAATKGTLTIDAERGDLGYVAHEPLLYRELTALENLEL